MDGFLTPTSRDWISVVGLVLSAVPVAAAVRTYVQKQRISAAQLLAGVLLPSAVIALSSIPLYYAADVRGTVTDSGGSLLFVLGSAILGFASTLVFSLMIDAKWVRFGDGFFRGVVLIVVSSLVMERVIAFETTLGPMPATFTRVVLHAHVLNLGLITVQGIGCGVIWLCAWYSSFGTKSSPLTARRLRFRHESIEPVMRSPVDPRRRIQLLGDKLIE